MPRREVRKVQKIRRNVQSGLETVDAHVRGKDFITEAELKKLIAATKFSRYRWRDAAMFQLMFWHGLRVTELCNLRLTDIDLDAGRIFVRRLKGSLDTHQPLLNDELRALKKYLKQREEKALGPVFLTERGTAFTRSGIYYLIRKSGEKAGFGVVVHPHMLRHGCGYELANRGNDTRLIQDYLGHRDIKHTARYTRTNVLRFEHAWS